jgi:polygalacturonase/predicted small secreted protein
MRTLFLALLSLATAFLFSSCSTTGGMAEKDIQIDWPKPSGKVIKISDTITFSGTKDYKMATVDGGGLRGNGNQDEDQEAPFYMLRSSTLKNVVAKSWPESVSVREGKATLENVSIPDVGEDAISTYKNHSTQGVVIRNCRFAKAEDKCLQLNEGTGDVLIENCYFDYFKSAIRIKSGVKNVTIKDCAFLHGTRAIVLDPGVQKPKIINCSVYNGVVLLYQGK